MTVTGRPAAVLVTAQRRYLLLEVAESLRLGMLPSRAEDEPALNEALRVVLDAPRPPLWRRVRAIVLGW